MTRGEVRSEGNTSRRRRKNNWEVPDGAIESIFVKHSCFDVRVDLTLRQEAGENPSGFVVKAGDHVKQGEAHSLDKALDEVLAVLDPEIAVGILGALVIDEREEDHHVDQAAENGGRDLLGGLQPFVGKKEKEALLKAHSGKPNPIFDLPELP